MFSYKVSIIVPVYNVQNYLEKCLDSILEQTYNDLEIILVDDGSTDKSGFICDSYEKKDKRVKVIHKKNGGLSAARNAGLEIASGDYLLFIDSDDWIENDYVNYLLHLIIQYKTDISICEIINITENGRIINNPLNDNCEVLLDEKRSLLELLKTRLFSTSVCGKMFCRKLFSNRRFPVGKIYEDIPVVYDIFLEGHKVAFGAKGLYYYLLRQNSITKSKFSTKRLDAISFITEAMDKVDLIYPEFKNLTDLRRFLAFFTLMESFSNDELSQKYVSLVRKEIKKYRMNVIFSRGIRNKDRMKAFISFFDYRVIRFIMKVYKK